MSFRLRYQPPPALPPAGARDLEAAIYDLSEAGAGATVEFDGYRLALDGTGLGELHRQTRRLLEVLATSQPAPGDETLRAELPDVPPGTILHSWIFSSFMRDLPVIVFAIAPDSATIYARTRAEESGWPLTVLAGRDLDASVTVPVGDVASEARAFLDACDADAGALIV